MAEKKDGGDISSGHGDPQVDGPVSDEKAQEMLYEGKDQGADELTEDAASDEAASLTDQPRRPDGVGGGGGGAW